MLNKSTIIFISGWGFKASVLEEVQYYSKKFILIDLPHLNELTLESIASYLAPRIPNNSVIIGWSLGGLIGIQLASQFPEKVKKLVLLSSSPYFSESGKWAGINKKDTNKFLSLAKKDIKKLFDYFLSLVNYPNKMANYKHLLSRNLIDFYEHKDYLINYLDILFKADGREMYSMIKIPLLHILGSRDAIVRVNPKALIHLNKQAKIHLISEAGHIAFLTHADKYCNQLIQFITND